MTSLLMYYMCLFLLIGVETNDEIIPTENPHISTTTSWASWTTPSVEPFVTARAVPAPDLEVYWFNDWWMSLTTCDNGNEAFGLIIKGQSELWKCLNFWFLIERQENTTMYDVDIWRDTLESNCRTFESVFVKCVENLTSLCGEEIRPTIDGWVAEMRGRMCEPGTNNILRAVDKYLTELKPIEEVEIEKLFETLNTDVFVNCVQLRFDPQNPERGEDYAAYFTRLSNDILQCIRVELWLIDIDDILKSFYLYFYEVTGTLGIQLDSPLVFKGFNLVPRRKRRSTVKVFGDPHMEVYNNGFMTCGALGRRTYLKNKYVNITGTNTAASEGSEATYMTMVHITFHKTYGIIAEYWAGNSTLPDDFVGGDQSVLTATPDVLTLTPMPGNMVRLVHNMSGIAIVLRRIRHTYMLVVRAADVVFAESSGLLIQGCASSDVIVVTDGIYVTEPQRRRRRSTICDSVDVELRQFCKFDYNVTGDKELAESINKVVYVEEKAVELDIQLGGAVTTEQTTTVTPDNAAVSLTWTVTLWTLVLAHNLK